MYIMYNSNIFYDDYKDSYPDIHDWISFVCYYRILVDTITGSRWCSSQKIDIQVAITIKALVLIKVSTNCIKIYWRKP